MIRDLKPYPAMKDSGVPWLGEVPEHWQVRRGKWLFRSKKGLNSDLRNSNILSLTLRGVVNNNPDDPEGLVPKDYATYQLFEKDDLVFKLIDLENIRTSRVGLVHEDGIMSPAYVRLVQAHDGIQRYFFQQYFDLYQRGVFNQLGAGVRSTLAARDLLEVFVLHPTVQEQAAIVRFLDYADRRIRRYIRAKQKLIKLLEEQKQAIIHRAVTRGLDPNVCLKPSGVEWLGDVPEHWEVLPLKRVARTRSGDGISSDDVQAQPTEHDSIQVIGGNGPMGYTRTANTNSDVLVIGRVGALCGNVHEVHKPVWVTDNALILSLTRDAFELRYLAAVLRTRNLNEIADRTAQPLITGTKVRAQTLPVPPLAEQTAIVEHLAQITDAIGRTITGARRKIDLLREYRTRLIADVVTGKLDVREAAARLPDEAEEPEPIDEIEAEDEADETGADDTDEVPQEAKA